MHFSELSFDILIPDVAPTETLASGVDILNAPVRKQLFFDEVLNFYLVIRTPTSSTLFKNSKQEEIASLFHSLLQIQVQVDVRDGSSVENIDPSTQVYEFTEKSGSYENTQHTNGHGGNSTTNGKPFIEGGKLSRIYNLRPKEIEKLKLFQVNDELVCLYPLGVPLAFAKVKGQELVAVITIFINEKSVQDSRKISQSIPKEEEEEGESLENMDIITLMGNLSYDIGSLDDSADDSPTTLLPSSYPFPRVGLPLEKITLQKTISITQALEARIRTTVIGDKASFISLCLKCSNQTPVLLEKVETTVTNATVTYCGDEDGLFPMSFQATDHSTFLFDVNLIENSVTKNGSQASLPPLNGASYRKPSYQQQPPPPPKGSEERAYYATITVLSVPQLDCFQGRSIRSEWKFPIEVSTQTKRVVPNTPNLNMRPQSSPVPNRRQLGSAASDFEYSPSGAHPNLRKFIPASTKLARSSSLTARPNSHLGIRTTDRRDMLGEDTPTLQLDNGVFISFTIPETPIVARKFFSVELFFVNQSGATRNLTVVIPNRKFLKSSSKSPRPNRPASDASTDSRVAPMMRAPDFLRRQVEHEKSQATMLCLESNVQLSPLQPSSCQKIQLHLITTTEHLHTLLPIQILDTDTGSITNLRDVLEFYVEREAVEGIH
ncbi:hypothetical protein K493DRAFT_314954 [Basidiobolus meristosporus CBS 931.73]|uniref:Trafficking protein particle complex II-specific subunit 65 IgD3 domain-containing protein n=1 Tax=Basidiobolus meristosporus CBS 931.73 TaxID=1314790 RepID=A0A1Y1YBX2_9FUNG|nr:hypothetical protein K493DRAFT_314954 [Basidiobolus meristosporus CBS 931.73]|eukprot:ORX95520.1 hypothetical protein K493DRAFT_314954 [Basidiobolus meristosporus CBS 931.73]